MKITPKLFTAFTKTQPSMVNDSVSLNAAESGTDILELTPSELKAWPTSPGANVAPLRSVPLCPPTTSLAFPSPGHQATRPAGGVTHEDGGGLHFPALPAL